MFQIDYNSYRTVTGFNRRVRFLVLHYTAANFKSSITTLTNSSVSAHYVVPDPSDKTYIDAGFNQIKVFNIVDELERAWHAGVSFWAGRSNLNDTSIGIEMINLATDNGGVFQFPPYHPEQIKAVKELAKNIVQRYPDITPTNIVGHSDIAPGRKSDPGPAFPWKELYDEGVGAWYDDSLKKNYHEKFINSLPSKEKIISKLKRYGYNTENAHTDVGYQYLIRAVQLHFRPENYDGRIDPETAAIIYALTDKYFP